MAIFRCVFRRNPSGVVSFRGDGVAQGARRIELLLQDGTPGVGEHETPGNEEGGPHEHDDGDEHDQPDAPER
jgi:hypothetical protein